jgi:hypothetical protein
MTVRFIPLKLDPPKIRITQEEILADLRYPATGKPAKPKAKRR